jgi:SEC-C motif-containing protein
MLVAPVYAVGLKTVARALMPALEATPDTRYEVESGSLIAYRPIWLPKQKRLAPLVQPLWVPAANYGVPLLAALILATPGWSWRRRGRASLVGLGWLTLTQVAFVLVTIVATQQGPIMTADGFIHLPGHSPIKQPIFYWLYYFFDMMGRGFFALFIYLALIALGWTAADRDVVAGPVGRNDPCPCGSGLKYKRCCQA